MDTLAAMFPDQSSAAAAIEGLIRCGFSRASIGLLVAETAGVQHRCVATHASVDGTAANGVVTAGLVVTGIVAAPGVGLVAAGPLVSILAAVRVGVSASSAIGALIGLGIPEQRARVMSDHLARGGILVTVDVRGPQRRHLAERLLRTHHAVSISRAAA